jgi:hypothetical protein
VWVVLLPVLAVVALSAQRWSTVPLWRDEYATAMHASLAPSDLFRAVSTGDAVQAPYYLLIHWLSPIFGLAEGMRLISLLAVAAATGVIALAGLRWWGGLPALAAATFFAVNINVVTAASTARPYALVLLMVAVSLLMVDLALEGRRWAWPVYGIAAASAVGMHLISILAVGCTVLLVLWRGRSSLSRWLAWTVPAVCATLLIGLAGFGQRDQISWLLPPDVRSAVATLAATTGLSANRAAVFDGVALLLLAAAAVLSVWAAWRLPSVERKTRLRPVLVGLALTFGAPLAMFVCSHIAIAVYTDRYLTWTAIGGAIIVGAIWFAALHAAKAMFVVCGVVASILSLGSLGLNMLAVIEPAPLFDDVPALTDKIESLADSGDAIVVIETNPHFAVAYSIAAGLGDSGWEQGIRDRLVSAARGLEVRELIQTNPAASTSLIHPLDQGRSSWIVTLGSPTAEDSRHIESEIGCDLNTRPEPVATFGLMHLTRGECATQ